MTKSRYEEIKEMSSLMVANIPLEEWREFLSHLTGTSPVAFENENEIEENHEDLESCAVCNLHLSELLLIREELFSIIDNISVRGFGLDKNCAHIDFQKVRYKRLVRLYDKLDECIIDMLDELQGKAES